jgi:hypothetical protein
MADQKVSNLPALNGADVDSADLLYIVDSSAGTAGSKKITIGQYQLAPVSGGTANGVTYLNGSKVLTSGSALTFDGTNLGIGTSSPGEKLAINQGNFYALRTGGAKLRLADQNNEVSVESLPVGVNSDMVFKTSTTTRMTLDSSGNLGLGVTPSAWSTNRKAVQIGGSSVAALGLAAQFSEIAHNAISQVSGPVYATSNPAAIVDFNNATAGGFAWRIAPSGTAGNAISFTQAMTLDASSNLTVTGYGRATSWQVVNNGIVNTFGANASGTVINNDTGAPIQFQTASTERARITSGGDLLVGDTTQPTSADNKLAVVGTRGIDCKNTGGATAPNITAWNNATTGDNIFVSFRTETTDTARGSISYNRAGGLVAYNTTSDYRAKDILGPVADPGATIDALKVYEGQMKGATQSRPMLVAHEAQAVAPYSVTGEKDAVNDDGDPVFQQMDVSSLVPLLIAEIQSLRARVAALEAK